MGYRNLEERDAGREALMEMEAEKRADFKADDLLKERESKLLDDQARISEVEEAEARGIMTGSRAGQRDATEFFARQGFIPGQIFNNVQGRFNQAEADDEMQYAIKEENSRGLGIPEEVANKAVFDEADKISSALVKASMQGAPKDEINRTLTELNVPDAIKRESAKMFIEKSIDIENTNQSMGESRSGKLEGTAVERMGSPITAYSQQLASQTDSLIQRLHEKLSGQQQQAG